MKFRSQGVLALVSFLLILVPYAASADVDVAPDGFDPSALRIDAEHGVPGDARPAADPHDKTVEFECPQAPGARAAGLPCEVHDFPGTFSFEPEIAMADIERAVRRIPMPALRAHVQPSGEVLVNIPTIFYTEPRTLRQTVTLLGHEVHVVARPVAYAWHHGDGTTARTSRPGRPYPAKDVTHRYMATGEDLRIGVDTSYAVTYTVDGGPQQELSGTLTAVGPSSTIDVTEAAPILTH